MPLAKAALGTSRQNPCQTLPHAALENRGQLGFAVVPGETRKHPLLSGKSGSSHRFRVDF